MTVQAASPWAQPPYRHPSPGQADHPAPGHTGPRPAHPGPGQPAAPQSGPANPGPAHPRPAQAGPIQPGHAEPGPAQGRSGGTYLGGDRATHYPTVSPRRGPAPAEEQPAGPVYRPGPVPPVPQPEATRPATRETSAESGSAPARPAQAGPPAPAAQTWSGSAQSQSGAARAPSGPAQRPGQPAAHGTGPQVPPAQPTQGNGPQRPHPQGPHGNGPQTPHTQPPHGNGPHPQPPHGNGPQGPHAQPAQGHGPHGAGPQAPGPQHWPADQQPGDPRGRTPQQAPPGPYPPGVDPRAVAPHPQVHQPQAGGEQPTMDPFQQLPWVSDGTPTAEEFARRRLAKPPEPTATMGARAIVTKGTMGLLRLAPGKRELEYKQDVEKVRRNFGGLRQVTVVNPKGGAGKTVAVLLLAMTFGQKRGGYVLAWDNNETQGTLGMRAQQDFHARTVRDMMRDLHLFRGSHGRVGDLSQYVRAQGEGMFDVLASDESATAGEMLTASAFAEIREIVSRFYKLIFVDTGNNVRAQNWQAAMDATDQLVITMSARNDSAETAARMLDHLEQSGRQRLVRQAVSVVSMPPTRKDIDLPAIQRHFAARTRAVLLAPYERLIDSGEPLRYGQLSANTRDAWLKIAAAVAEGL
ncbi:chromosome partitioning protein [Krasilnikovia sp. MM14-A1004]|uniref:MinD/ParA family ATP-binding protein n=1 Tax=Krasilnikovia sp. MM14-A1004 TaxID=3373541 RepID=UPI00399CBE82